MTSNLHHSGRADRRQHEQLLVAVGGAQSRPGRAADAAGRAPAVVAAVTSEARFPSKRNR